MFMFPNLDTENIQAGYGSLQAMINQSETQILVLHL